MNKWIDHAVLAALATIVAAAVGGVLNWAPDISVPHRLFYLEAGLPAPEGNARHTSMIMLINPRDRGLQDVRVTLRPKDPPSRDISVATGTDGDFEAGGSAEYEVNAQTGAINVHFRHLPAEARYYLFVTDTRRYQVRSNSEGAVALRADGSTVPIAKLKEDDYRSFDHEEKVYFLGGLLAGILVVLLLLAVRRLAGRRRR